MKLNKRLFGLIICIICFCALFSSCTPGGGEVTTEALTEPTPETSLIVDETTAPETDGSTTEETTTEIPPETTEHPSAFEAKVYVYDPLGNAKEHIIKSTTLPSSALETVNLPIAEDRIAKLIGWEYSITKDG
ncbi:MAG: hypothetical protein II319_04955, partial [Clostridia bacterium]|nr:hypothetical protein [Clostridia bacterium]